MLRIIVCRFPPSCHRRDPSAVVGWPGEKLFQRQFSGKEERLLVMLMMMERKKNTNKYIKNGLFFGLFNVSLHGRGMLG